jgi:hypothetical protein
MDKQKAQKIVRWWCDRMDDQRKHDNSYAETEAKINELEAIGFISKPKAVTDGQKYRFSSQLEAILMANSGRIESLSVDYDPDPILEDCLFFAGIKGNPLPIKTILWTESMTCRIGYSGEVHSVEVQ